MDGGLHTVEEAVTKTIPKKNKWKKAKWLSEEALQNGLRGEEKQKAKKKGKDIPIWVQSFEE